MRLIPDWRRAWRMLSVQLAALAVIVGTLPTDMQSALLELLGVPPERLPAAIGVLIIIGRLIDQPAARSQDGREE